MIECGITKHAVQRMAQRSIREDDVDLIILIGTEVDDGFIVRTKDCQSAERHLKRLLDQIRRLDGKRVVMVNGRIVTAYRPRQRVERRLLRGVDERSSMA